MCFSRLLKESNLENKNAEMLRQYTYLHLEGRNVVKSSGSVGYLGKRPMCWPCSHAFA